MKKWMSLTRYHEQSLLGVGGGGGVNFDLIVVLRPVALAV